MLDSMHVEEYIAEMNIGIEGISSIHEEYNEALKVRREEKQNRFNLYILALSTVFVVIETINSIWDIANKIHDDDYPLIGSIEFVGGIISIILICIVTLYLLKKYLEIAKKS